MRSIQILFSSSNNVHVWPVCILIQFMLCFTWLLILPSLWQYVTCHWASSILDGQKLNIYDAHLIYSMSHNWCMWSSHPQPRWFPIRMIVYEVYTKQAVICMIMCTTSQPLCTHLRVVADCCSKLNSSAFQINSL